MASRPTATHDATPTWEGLIHMMDNMNVGFIGTGNMGAELVRIAARTMDASKIFISNRSAGKTEALLKETGVRKATNEEIAQNCHAIFLGLKPQMMPGMLKGIAHILAKRTDEFLLVTMAAGLTIAQIRDMAGGAYPVIRIMPNLAVAVGEGMTLYTASENVTREQDAFFHELLRFSGTFDLIPEELMDVGCAISGCGPAFVFIFIESLADGAVECGLPRDKALRYAAQTLYGASKLLMESGRHPGELKDKVSNPGGSTIVGIHAMEKQGFRAAVMDAVTASYQKTAKLGG